MDWIMFFFLLCAESMGIYDDIDADVLRNYQEFSLVNLIYFGMKESTTSEQSARMTAMDSASKNACELSFHLVSLIRQVFLCVSFHFYYIKPLVLLADKYLFLLYNDSNNHIVTVYQTFDK